MPQPQVPEFLPDRLFRAGAIQEMRHEAGRVHHRILPRDQPRTRLACQCLLKLRARVKTQHRIHIQDVYLRQPARGMSGA